MVGNRRTIRTFLGIACLIALTSASFAAGTSEWDGTVGDWFDAGKWSNGIPSAGVHAIINVGSVALTNSTAALASLTVNGGSLTFSNWTTKLSATNVYLNGGNVTVAGPFTNIQDATRVWIACSNIVIAAGGQINVNNLGYEGGDLIGEDGFGPGGGFGATSGYRGSGAGYGGKGSYGSGGSGKKPGFPYGSATNAGLPGSGGGCGNNLSAAGNGGGCVRLWASGMVTINGVITANGGNPTGNGYGAGGSGGGIRITCRTLAGTNGTIRANGGRYSVNNYDDGGGGRIAVHYDSTAQAAMPIPSIRLLALPADGFVWNHADLGTINLTDSRFLSNAITNNIAGRISGFASWAPNSLLVSNTWIRFDEPAFQLTVTNNVTISGTDTRFELGGNACWTDIHHLYTRKQSNMDFGPSLAVGGNVRIENNARFYIYAGMSNSYGTN